jgi:hypothetical protein
MWNNINGVVEYKIKEWYKIYLVKTQGEVRMQLKQNGLKG